jgi:hypothetical protein
MTRRIVIILPILLVAIGLIYFNLPFQITRKSDIGFGNKLVSRIKDYQNKYDKLPEPEDSETLLRLGFRMGTIDVEPAYEKINDNEFEIIYFKGFDGPYLLYNSKADEWKVDFPTIPERWNEKDKN